MQASIRLCSLSTKRCFNLLPHMRGSGSPQSQDQGGNGEGRGRIIQWETHNGGFLLKRLTETDTFLKHMGKGGAVFS